MEKAKKLHLEDSTEDWQIGPFEQDMEEGIRVKCQLGHRFVFVARWRVLPFGDNYHPGLVFERMLDTEDVFCLDDAYVLIDGVFHMQRLASLAILSEMTASTFYSTRNMLSSLTRKHRSSLNSRIVHLAKQQTTWLKLTSSVLTHQTMRRLATCS